MAAWGPFVIGETPEPFTYTFSDDGLTTEEVPAEWLAVLVFEKPMVLATRSREAIERPLTVDEDGLVVVAFDEGDIDEPGRYDGRVWVGDGTSRKASERLTWWADPTPAIPTLTP